MIYAHEMVSVQPMTTPVAAIFYLDFLYGQTKTNDDTRYEEWQTRAWMVSDRRGPRSVEELLNQVSET